MNSIMETYYQVLQYTTALSGGCSGYGYFGGGPGGYMWYHGHFMMIALFILLVAAVYLVARYAGSSRRASATSDTPLDIIKIRYARGEITKEQYESLKTDLKT